jgi:hemerythrin-like metal-binding protein
VELLNTLVGHLAFQLESPAVEQIFDELKNYTVLHFTTEEAIWRQYFNNDPWEKWHKDAHADFVAKVLDLKKNEANQSLDEVIEGIVSFLTHWLALHIIESDRRMAKVVLALPSGISLERAKEMANNEMSGATRVLIDTVMGMYDKLANRTIQMTREINIRIKAEAALQQAQTDMEALRDHAVNEEQRIRAAYEKMLAEHEAQTLQTQRAMEQTIAAISSTVASRDPYTAGHQNQVAEIACDIAARIGLDAFRIKGLKLAALVHDVGKVHIPLQILCKPSRLTELEFELIKTHPQEGYNILKDMDLPWPLAQTVLQHHEYLDGSGYPNGLRGDDILLTARILTVADIVESMTSARPYRPALGLDAALQELQRLRGTKLDPVVVDACMAHFRGQGA